MTEPAPGISSVAPSAAPGWYPVPGDPGLRWWDGHQWTQHTHPGTPAAPSGDITTATGPAPHRNRRRHNLTVMIAALAISGAFIAIASYFLSSTPATQTESYRAGYQTGTVGYQILMQGSWGEPIPHSTIVDACLLTEGQRTFGLRVHDHVIPPERLNANEFTAGCLAASADAAKRYNH